MHIFLHAHTDSVASFIFQSGGRMSQKILNVQQRKYLKFFHLFFAALWGGGATAMVMLFCIYHPTTVHEQIALNKVLLYLDFIIVGPGAGGCLITGLIYSVYTNWGFFKFRWIVLKYAVNITFITYGTLIFLPFTHSQYTKYMALAKELAMPPESALMNIFCTAQNFCTIMMFLFVVYISVFKPFGKFINNGDHTVTN